MDIVGNIEKVSADLDALIERRALKAAGEQQAIEDLWKASAAVHREQTLRENRAAWYAHHEHMRELHEGLAREHEAKASALLEEGTG